MKWERDMKYVYIFPGGMNSYVPCAPAEVVGRIAGLPCGPMALQPALPATAVTPARQGSLLQRRKG